MSDEEIIKIEDKIDTNIKEEFDNSEDEEKIPNFQNSPISFSSESENID